MVRLNTRFFQVVHFLERQHLSKSFNFWHAWHILPMPCIYYFLAREIKLTLMLDETALSTNEMLLCWSAILYTILIIIYAGHCLLGWCRPWCFVKWISLSICLFWALFMKCFRFLSLLSSFPNESMWTSPSLFRSFICHCDSSSALHRLMVLSSVRLSSRSSRAWNRSDHS